MELKPIETKRQKWGTNKKLLFPTKTKNKEHEKSKVPKREIKKNVQLKLRSRRDNSFRDFKIL